MKKTKIKKLAVYVLGFTLGVGVWCILRTTLVRAGVFDFLSAHVRHARLKQQLASHQLIIPTLEEHGFSPQAFVLLGSVHRKTKHLTFSSPAVAFVIGDGSLVLSAAHCVRAHHTPRPNQVATEQFIISPYYGELFEYEVLAIDDEYDIAALRPNWERHPALQLGTEQDLKDTNDIYICGKRLYDTDLLALGETPPAIRPDWFYRVRMEKLALWKRARGSKPDSEVVMKSARFVLPGWSGSAFIQPASATVVGLLTQHRDYKSHGVTTSHLVSGCSIRSIQAVLLDPNGPYRRALGNACAKLGRLDEAQKHLHWMTDNCACPTCWTVYANFLITYRGKDPNALNSAQALFPKIETAKDFPKLKTKLTLARLSLLKEESIPEALRVTKRHIEEDPNCAYYWWALADLLRSDGQNHDAAEAAQTAVNLDPSGPFRPRLANCLARAGHIDQAQQAYDQMLREHPDRGQYWCWYAQFLIDHHPERHDSIQTAWKKATDPNSPWPADPNELAELKQQWHPQQTP
jgi:tetratricopeptide (TPR) repeat protein